MTDTPLHSSTQAHTTQDDPAVLDEQASAQRSEPGPGFRACVGVMFLLVLIHVARLGLSGDAASDVLIRFGVIPGAVFLGEWWRLLSGCLLHQGWTHLGSNLFGLLIFGNLLEPILGSRSLLLLLITSGVLGNLLSCFLMPPDSLSIGASGMVYGLTGAYICLNVMLQRKLDSLAPADGDVHPKKAAGQLRGAIILLVVFIALHSQEPQLNLWAHLGGLATGVCFAPLWLRSVYNTPHPPFGHPLPKGEGSDNCS